MENLIMYLQNIINKNNNLDIENIIKQFKKNHNQK